MAHDLEYPGADGVPDWASLYRARGDEVVRHRPVFTGDVFEKVLVQGPGESRTKTVIVLQHPCALRSNGVDLHSRLMVAELRNHKVIPIEGWTGHVGKMPLPELIPALDTGRRHQAGFFDEPYLVGPDDLTLDKRIACLSQTGVNLLLQRWVHHNSRVVVPTATYQEVSSPAYEEADLIEEWCEERVESALTIQEAAVEAMKWLREDTDGGVTRQRMLEDPQNRSTVRRQMRTALRQLR
ncbi:MAG: hypothetical protein ACRDS9_02770 [Pseudonocardiaceae bacterium]